MKTKKEGDSEKNDGTFTRYFSGILVLCGISYLCAVTLIDYQYPGTTVTVNITGSQLTISRSEHLTLIGRGGDNLEDLYKSLGWMHAQDRYVQLCIMRLASQGLLTDTFPYTDYNYGFDIIARQFDFKKISEENLKLYDKNGDAVTILQAYVDGLNEYIANNKRPFEFMLVNYQPPPFTMEDVLTFIRFISYVGLDEIAFKIENFIMKAIRTERVSTEYLKDTFYPHLENLTAEHVEMYRSLKEIKPRERASIIPAIVNSNNWVISG